jgi:hypothetical protein
MEDRSMIKPILDALEYFSTSEEELEFFYNVVDKFCAAWFGKPVFASHFSKIDYALLHELLGEYIRFESNNKRIALWILAINRVCYNFTASLDSVKYEICEMEDSIDDSFDTTLIDPIVSSLKSFERQHLNAGVNDKGENDGVGDFLQWVGIYVTYVYPSLENKQNFYDKNIVKAMNYLLVEFIKQAKLFNAGFFKYSREEGTPAYKLQGQVPSAIKTKRHKKLYSVQKAVVKENVKSLMGSTVRVLAEGFDQDELVYYGRAYFNAPEIDGKVYFFSKSEVQYGKYYQVKIIKATGYDLYGERV